jgi:hypothetical protein
LTNVERQKILLVDDNETLLESTRLFLQSRGFNVSATSSPFGVSALIQRE